MAIIKLKTVEGKLIGYAYLNIADFGLDEAKV